MQTSHDEDHVGAGAAGEETTEGILGPAYSVMLCRSDWSHPVGCFPEINHTRIDEGLFTWGRLDIPVLHLGHTATLLLLQGRKLGDILIPNHYIEVRGAEPGGPFFHLLARVDPWDYTLAPPRLTNLVLANLASLPDGLDDQEVLGAIAQRVLRG